MKKTPTDRVMLALFALGIVTSFATGGFIATKWVSPCVCVIATTSRIN